MVDTRAKNQGLLEMIQSLCTNNEQLFDRIYTTKNQSQLEKIIALKKIALTLQKNPIHIKGTGKLSEINHAEFENQNLFKKL